MLLFLSCSKDDTSDKYVPTPLALDIPPLFVQKLSPPVIPHDNPQTIEGVALGKKLFFDTILSADNTQSCASCHAPENAFTDASQFSEGIDGVLGGRNSMAIFNIAWNYDEKFFWDGRAFSAEHQALQPVENPIEMHNTWGQVVVDLQEHSEYPDLFKQSFGTEVINSELITKAIAQFERTLISGNSKFDKYLIGTETLTPQELSGFDIFMNEERGDCFRCHGSDNGVDNELLWTDNKFHNIGLDDFFIDEGLAETTEDPLDVGKFKTPSLRNLVFTAPYMHDGRFDTIEGAIRHYINGVKPSPTLDSVMKVRPVVLSSLEEADLKAFLLTLSDYEFINNPAFQN